MLQETLPKKLRKGLVVPIYIQTDQGGLRYEFTGELIEEVPNWRELAPYVHFHSIPETNNINAQKKLWKVKIHNASVFEEGREFIRWVPEFHSKGSLIEETYEEE